MLGATNWMVSLPPTWLWTTFAEAGLLTPKGVPAWYGLKEKARSAALPRGIVSVMLSSPRGRFTPHHSSGLGRLRVPLTGWLSWIIVPWAWTAGMAGVKLPRGDMMARRNRQAGRRDLLLKAIRWTETLMGLPNSPVETTRFRQG